MKRKLQAGNGAIYDLLKYLLALVAVLLLGVLLIGLQGQSVAAAGKAMLTGALGSTNRIGNTIRWITPCLLTGISATVAFRSGIWNMGVGGQLYMGAFGATVTALFVPMYPVIGPVLCLLAGVLAGIIWAAIPALLKRFLNVNEMITTLMLNYIATLLTTYFVKLINGISANNNSKALATPLIPDEARLTNLIPKTNASTGVFIAIAMVALMCFIYRYTIAGYEMRMVGANPRFARTGGVRINKVYLTTFLLSGAVAGLAGAIEILGVYGKFTADFASNIGWDGIMIATIAMYHPLATGAVGVLWGALKSGSLYMEAMTDTNRLTVEVLLAFFVLFVTVDYRRLLKKRSHARKGAESHA